MAQEQTKPEQQQQQMSDVHWSRWSRAYSIVLNRPTRLKTAQQQQPSSGRRQERRAA